jgi:uncharacterized protein with PQ loop repeat
MFVEIIEKTFFGALLVNALLFLPQIILLLRVKKSDSVSVFMFCSFAIIQVISIIYGYIKKDIYMVIGYSASLVTCIITIFLIFFFRNTKE